MTDANKCNKQINKTLQALFDLNVHFGGLLDDGLEDKVDQLYNLLDKQLKASNTSEEM